MKELSRRNQLLLLLIVAALLFGGGVQYAVWQSRSSSPTPGPTSPLQQTGAGVIFVHVAGAVEKPGLYQLPAGSRVNDALAKAGLLQDANLEALNLAAVLRDGEKIRVALIGEVLSTGTVSPLEKDGGGKLDLNAATLAELDSLPGIGQALAQRIVDYRTKNSPFKTPEDVTNVSGIGQNKFNQIKDLITVR